MSKVIVYVVIGITECEPDAFTMKVFASKADAEKEFETQTELNSEGDYWYLSEQEIQ